MKLIEWIAIEWIRPNQFTKMASLIGDKDFLNTFDEYFQRRFLAPLIHSRLNAPVNAPENIRSHMVI